MTAVNQNFEMWIGEDKTLSCTVTVGEGGPRSDITSATITWAIARDAKSSAEVTLTTTAGDITITDGSNGEFEIAIEPTDTNGLEEGEYYHECQVEYSTGDKNIVFTGTLTLNEGLI